MKPARSSFPQALRLARRAKGITQEAFDEVSSRTYVSAMERGLKSPTLSKVDALAQVLGVHPLSLLVLSFVPQHTPEEMIRVLDLAREEALAILKEPRS